ncbi:glycosyltransferase [Ferrimonas aestuarii]|uniref:Glycosyltransferase family 4 protein n=1 Tax=Ferrimonas aestuarii TaxID=2569539 RepID=A0A4U1BQJ5_9GAMM|nr:glycosyltransferase [Ferrimonas aestuarii]TKB57287.1 glycosyltransferase family 4 protein [Ferrimonas aestuarii]
MKRLGYVLPSFPVASETFVVNEMQAMRDRGHDVVAMALTQNASETLSDLHKAWLPKVGFAEQISPSNACITMTRASFNRSMWQFVSAQQGISAKSLLWSAAKVAYGLRHCEHIHAHFAQSTAAIAIVAAKMLGVTVSFVGHGADVYSAPADLQTKLAHVDLSIAVCRQMQQDFRDLNQPRNVKVALVPCGIDTRLFTQNRLPSKSANTLLFVGRLVEKKGVDTLISAMAKLPTLKLHIVGSGPLEAQLKAQADAQGLTNVQFLGWRSQQWLAAQANRYLALCAPYRIAANGDRDTGPLVCKEALAQGIPLIVSNLMGLKEIVSCNTGFQVQPDDVHGIVRAARTLNALPIDEYRKLSLQCRLRAQKHFDVGLQAQRLSRLFEAVA